ncbi:MULTISPECIES: hypothetical protein [unclassified Caballeronia]|jgi:hypothetical protein|nr:MULTISPECIES: hypothetical protein [unclassified Caballeronia]
MATDTAADNANEPMAFNSIFPKTGAHTATARRIARRAVLSVKVKEEPQ